MNNLINDFESIIRWPKKRTEQDFIIKWLSSKFDFKKNYSEKEINNIINNYHSFNDTCLLRRELISKNYLHRKNDGSEYWKIK
mgnify:CR=1 FL=1